jgi:hypothetical protein
MCGRGGARRAACPWQPCLLPQLPRGPALIACRPPGGPASASRRHPGYLTVRAVEMFARAGLAAVNVRALHAEVS